MKILQNLALGTLIAFALPALSAPEEEKETFSITVNDKLGKGEIFGTITTKIYDTAQDYYQDKTLKIVRKDQNGKQVWKVQDFVKECPVDTTLQMVKPIHLTDLNDNGLAEVWMIYKLACRGDVSPADMKIIMYEGTTKHAVRGNMRINGVENLTDSVNSQHTLDANMKNAHEYIREHAEDLWKKNELEF